MTKSKSKPKPKPKKASKGKAVASSVRSRMKATAELDARVAELFVETRNLVNTHELDPTSLILLYGSLVVDAAATYAIPLDRLQQALALLDKIRRRVTAPRSARPAAKRPPLARRR